MSNPKTPLITLIVFNIVIFLLIVTAQNTSFESKLELCSTFLGFTILLITTVYAAREKEIISTRDEFIIRRNILPRIVVKKRHFKEMNETGIFFVGKKFDPNQYENFEELMNFIKNQIDSYSERLSVPSVKNVEKSKIRFMLLGFSSSVGILIFLTMNHFFGINIHLAMLLILAVFALPAIAIDRIFNIRYK